MYISITNCEYHPVVEAEVAAAELAAPIGRLIPPPVMTLLVSLLSWPVGCKRFMGRLGSDLRNLLATIGPMIKHKKMMNMKK